MSMNTNTTTETEKSRDIKKARYVQFSKRMVVFTCISAMVISIFACILCYMAENVGAVQGIVQTYIGFATICFAAYSGNSVVEQWLIRKYGGQIAVVDATSEEPSQNG